MICYVGVDYPRERSTDEVTWDRFSVADWQTKTGDPARRVGATGATKNFRKDPKRETAWHKNPEPW